MIYLATVLLGIFSWSFAEYALHNWGGHLAKGKNPFSKEHLKHHAKKDYFSPHSKKSLMAVPVLVLMGFITGLWLSPLIACLYTLSFGLTYLGYEICHYRLHAYAPRGPVGRFLRKHHFHHHFQNPWTNHGVTSPIWDYVFRTKTPVEEAITVPKSHVLDWLCDEDGNIKTEYQRDYKLKQYA